MTESANGKQGHHHHHGPSADGEDQQALLNALTGSSDRGSRVTLIGLAANIALTAVKGIAGYLLASASLIADAGHSLSDLLGDLITLVAWNWSKRKPDPDYPFGYGKYESVGSLIVAFFLISGGMGIGFHSYTLFLPMVTSKIPTLAALLPTPSDGHHQHDIDIRASYFALLSIIVKESLYRITYKVGKAEESNVLIANALHHRSDAFSSLVALLAIVGSWFGLTILDPIGGFIVCWMIVSQGMAIGKRSVDGLVDKRQEKYLDRDIENLLLTKLGKTQALPCQIGVESVKHLRSGTRTTVFLLLSLAPLDPLHPSQNRTIHFQEWVAVQHILAGLITKEYKNVLDVYIKFSLASDPHQKSK